MFALRLWRIALRLSGKFAVGARNGGTQRGFPISTLTDAQE
ncbi:hypothetical protein EP837_02937 [Sphingobium sp. EP60837]|nr:hypothetical protein EP837_02937 [Sphingobium sp. EP60837]